eukprot:gnl/MRDRNA2_/MRDRNA2_76458_c0_seq1.p1 gnl/MRDRNA2_/MRDRNA2_76458_c0~~gnl/MRDRNA2_/MRDRNA2_76458_c0_seq1.p1  ORF type:complete len:306 (+),score=74.53 gnl/MRDRNA2_/MRDRNA2_76458_c0_seq1:67-918(+)
MASAGGYSSASIDLPNDATVQNAGLQNDSTSPLDNPKVVAVRGLLKKLSLSQAKSSGGVGQLVGAVAKGAHKAALIESPSEKTVEQLDSRLGTANERIIGFFSEEIKALWAALMIDEEEGLEALGMEQVEELVLAYLVALPEFLTESLLWSQLRHVSLGQTLMAPDQRRWDMDKAHNYFRAKLDRHRDLAANVADETCAMLLLRSEHLAGALLKRMDLDGDGVVGQTDFSVGVLNSLSLEIENVALSTGSETLMRNPDFSDDVHMAMGAAIGHDFDAEESFPN